MMKSVQNNQLPILAITRNQLPGRHLYALEEKTTVKVWPDPIGPTSEQLPEFLSDCSGLLSMSQDLITQEVIESAPSLKAIGQASAGFDNLDIQALTDRGIQASNTPGILAETTADFTWALLLAASRRLVEADQAVRSGDWKHPRFDYLLGQDVYKRTLGIIGYGQIGQAVAQRASGFSMNVLHASETKPSDKFATKTDMGNLLRSSDFISIHTALTPETRHLIDESAIQKMKPSVIVVNTSRGSVVDEKALTKALQTGRIAAAGLDVFESEPLDITSPLASLSNVVLTPHAGSGSLATRTAMVDLAVTNLEAAIEGKLMPNSITPLVTPQAM